MSVIYGPQSGSGWDLLGTIATLGGIMTGNPWIGAAYNAAKSAVNGDIGGAVINGTKAATGSGLMGNAAKTVSSATPAISSQVNSDPLYIQKGLSALNGSNNVASASPANGTLMFANALGRSPDTSYADAAKLAGTTTQYNNATPANSMTRNLLGGSSDTSYNDAKATDAANNVQAAADRAKMYDDKWNALTNMYGVADNSGKNLDAMKSYYQTYPVGNNQLDTQNNNGIFDALYRMFNWGR